jgi:hypothetical protein
MPDSNMAFLNTLRVIGGYYKGVIDEASQLAAAASQESNSGNSHFARLLDGNYDICGITGGRYGKEDIAFAAQSLKLTREYFIEPEIVGAGG